MPALLAQSFAPLLQAFQPCFTRPSFRSFWGLVCAWILCSGRRSLTRVIQSAQLSQFKHYCSFHRFFSQARWNLDELIASGCAIRADLDLPLRSGAVERESAERVPATGEERFADRDAAVVERLRQADAYTVGPHDVVKLLHVDGGLAVEPGEVDAGAQRAGIEIQFGGVEDAAVFVERIVARVAREIGGKSREANVLVFRQNQLGDEDVREVGPRVSVLKEDDVLVRAADRSLYLEGTKLLLE